MSLPTKQTRFYSPIRWNSIEIVIRSVGVQLNCKTDRCLRYGCTGPLRSARPQGDTRSRQTHSQNISGHLNNPIDEIESNQLIDASAIERNIQHRPIALEHLASLPHQANPKGTLTWKTQRVQGRIHVKKPIGLAWIGVRN